MVYNKCTLGLKYTFALGLMAISLNSFSEEVSSNDGDFKCSLYAGGGLGAGAFSIDDVNGLTGSKEDTGNSFGWKSYFGYQFSPIWGLEAGYASLGKVSNEYTQGKYKADADALFIAGTSRLLSYGNFSLKGRLILSSDHLDADKSNPKVAGFSELTGSRRGNLALGLGGEYKIDKQWTATLDIDNFGSYSKKVDGALATLGVKYHF